MNEDDRALLNFWEAERPDNKLQIPHSKLQRSTELQAQKPTCAPFAPASVFWVWCLRFGTSLELGVWCLVFRSAAAQKLRYGAPSKGRRLWGESPQAWHETNMARFRTKELDGKV